MRWRQPAASRRPCCDSCGTQVAAHLCHVEGHTVLPLLSRLEEEGTGTWTDELSAHLTRVLDCAGQVRDELQSILKKEEQA